VNNVGHLRHLKYIFAEHDVGFFYRNNLWIMLPNRKNTMTKEDVDSIDKINFNQVESNKIYRLNFSDREKFLGLGWTHNFNKEGVWSEGNVATLMLNLDKLKKDNHIFKADIEKYRLNNNNNYELKIFVNNKLKNIISFNKKNKSDTLEFKINKNEMINSTKIDFKFEGLISPFNLRINPDARKLGMLLKNFSINEL